MTARIVLTLALIACAAAPASAQTETIEYYGLDALGSVRVIFDQNGQPIERMDYGPFGENLKSAIKMSFEQFALLARDSETGQDYAEARNYSPAAGRFSTVDPVYAGLAQTQKWNRYSYALNNPLAYVDPGGLDACRTYTWNSETETYHCESYYEDLSNAANETIIIFTVTLSPLRAFGSGPSGGGGGGGAVDGQRTGNPQKDLILPKKEEETKDPCTVPEGPPGHSIKENVKRVIRTAANFATFAGAADWWRTQVKNQGPWDYKYYDKNRQKYEKFGNVNYGATGRALGLPALVLHAGAGAANLAADPDRLVNGTVFSRYLFDDKHDYEDIGAGIAYVDSGCHKK